MKNLIALLALFLLFTVTGYAGITLRFVDQARMPILGVSVTTSFVSFPPALPASGTVTDLGNGVVTITHPCALGSGSCCSLIQGTYSISKPGVRFSQTGGQVPCVPGLPEVVITGTVLPDIASVSAASYRRRLTNEMIVAAFGDGLASATENATLPLKTTLGGKSVLIRDSRGTEKNALPLLVSPGQINYIMPSGLADGLAAILLNDESGKTINMGSAEIGKVFPGIFTAGSDGQGVPAAIITRVKPDGSQVVEPVAQFDETQGKFVPIELDLGPESEFVVLSLFGTGWRQAVPVPGASVKIGGIDCPVEYFGKQPTIEGLDQFNARLPRTLIGRGDVRVEVIIGGEFANTVQLKFK